MHGCGNMGIKLGRAFPKTFRRANVTLSDFLPGKEYGNKKMRSHTVSPARSRRSSWVSRNDSPRKQSAPSSEDAIMEDCTESDQSEVNRKIKANDKLQNFSRRCQRQLSRENLIDGRREGSSPGRQQATPTHAM